MYGVSSVRIVAAKESTVKNQTALHWHDCLELELVTKGEGVHVINGKEFPMKAGDLYLLTKEDNHKVIARSPLTTLGIMFDEELLSQTLRFNLPSVKLAAGELLARVEGEKEARIRGCFRSVISEESEKSEPYMSSEYISGLIECIIIELFRALAKKWTAPLPSSAVNKALAYIHKHYFEALTLDMLSKELHLSPNYLSSYFKKSVGKNFKEYLIDLRIKHAARLLANTDMSVTEICFSCGFSSYSHFIRTFKSIFGETPLGFRNTHRS